MVREPGGTSMLVYEHRVERGAMLHRQRRAALASAKAQVGDAGGCQTMRASERRAALLASPTMDEVRRVVTLRREGGRSRGG